MANKSIASQFTGLPMKALIGAPLKAATDANAMISQTQTQFLITTCFERISTESLDLRPKMVKFQIERQVLDADGRPQDKPATMEFSVPLMTLIPLNSLAIETLTVSFEMEVKSSREFVKETAQDREHRSTKHKLEHSFKSHEFDTELHGTLTSKSKDSSNEKSGANYEITLTAGQLPLPKGVTTILDIFTKNMTPIPTKSNDQ